MKKTIKTLCLGAAAFTSLLSCQTGAGKKEKLSNGLDFQLIKNEKGEDAKIGDMIKMHVTTAIHDSVIFSTHMNGGEPFESELNQPAGTGDIMSGIVKMSQGDSAHMTIPIDSLIKEGQMPPFAKSGDIVEYRIKVISVKSKTDYEKELAEKNKAQNEADEKLIQDFLKKNNITAQKTASGLYYQIVKPGTGNNAQAGMMVKMNYTGKLLDGTTFDSNEDPKFQHPEPFEFALGQGMVIKGWDEGVALLNKGAKAMFYIPSTLAYGEREMPGNEINPTGIPANSVLVFNVELLDAKNP